MSSVDDVEDEDEDEDDEADDDASEEMLERSLWRAVASTSSCHDGFSESYSTKRTASASVSRLARWNMRMIRRSCTDPLIVALNLWFTRCSTNRSLPSRAGRTVFSRISSSTSVMRKARAAGLCAAVVLLTAAMLVVQMSDGVFRCFSAVQKSNGQALWYKYAQACERTAPKGTRTSLTHQRTSHRGVKNVLNTIS